MCMSWRNRTERRKRRDLDLLAGHIGTKMKPLRGGARNAKHDDD